MTSNRILFLLHKEKLFYYTGSDGLDVLGPVESYLDGQTVNKQIKIKYGT